MRGLDTKLADIDPSVFRLSTRKALKNLVDWALLENVDFVTLGGDNYDGDWRDHQTGLYFAQQMARLGAIPVVSITGNHDAQSKITRTLRLPPTFTDSAKSRLKFIRLFLVCVLLDKGLRIKARLAIWREGIPIWMVPELKSGYCTLR